MKKRESKLEFASFYNLLKKSNPPILLLTFAIIISLIETAASLIVPLFTRDFVDQFSAGNLEGKMIGLLVGAFFLQAIAGGVSYYLLAYSGQTIVANLRRRLWNHMLHLPIPYYDNHRTGETISRITNDTNVVMTLITRHVVTAISGFISIIGAVIILLLLDWRMTLVMLSAVPIMLLVIIPIGNKMYRIAKGTQKEMANFTNVLSEVLADIRLIKAYRAEEGEEKKGEERIKGLFQFGIKEAKIQAVLSPLIMLALMGMLVVIIGYGGVRVANGALSAGDLVAFILYLFLIIIPVSQFASFFAELQKAMGATERIQGILQHDGEDLAIGQELDAGEKAITFDVVHFSYENKEDVLKGVSLTISPGKITAIVGPSGSGKTTIFSMIERFYKPSKGTISFADENIEAISLSDWRRQLAYVSQESPLMPGTIKENLMLGIKHDVSEEELFHALELANSKEFIMDLPEGVNTEVGERGIKLSGGQRQRIAIARALLRKAPILMLDEATSSLDSNSEFEVQKALKYAMNGRTTIVIAHRLSTVVKADQIVFLEHGKVTGTGTHAELMGSHPLYKKLVEQQFISN
ncbi:ABC transporter ATP-binding protein [Alkalihalobacterium chitinilyticum]|uniref:ABC transporter ATP-binding protein/permease n=1 Tax=Alkalihalobacterium chitinilyticum TaxID=2980103 RepID=A0ABT5VB16_9BACI|nr:ABC transporter ATP-binding protein [Alkalihalobacterium chitinilyticum]MDE5412644.1 ABC transporter ATP-binding protein/permease [Alkalihalobacterium chitinilyticum]